MMKKIMIILLIIFLPVALFVLYLFFIGVQPAEKIAWGVNFSQKHAKDLGLDWKENYLALLDDLGSKNLKVAAHWDLIEPEKDKFYFDDLDWQINEAEKKGAKLLLVVGMKTPRWPECHIPGWAADLSKEKQQEEILDLIKNIVLRYRESSSIDMWQVENEPFFFFFGDCPRVDKEFLRKEIELVKSLDPQKRKVLISDSGEGSFWVMAARFGDIVGTTMYENVWVRQLGIYFRYPLTPNFYGNKAKIIKNFFDKEVICVELQAEPWGPKLLYDTSLEEQEKTMNLEQFRKNIEFARKTGLKEFYLWGGEWWYWMKEIQGRPEIWEEAKKLFTPHSNLENL